MDIDYLAGFAAQFGYGLGTAVDIPDASEGLLPTRIWKLGAKGEIWYPGDNLNVGIGQGDLLVTPLQQATVAAVLANRGAWVRPRMLLASDRPLVEFDPPRPMPRVQGPEPNDWELMVDAMEDVVHRGNKGFRQNGVAWAHIGRDIGYRMAGKSGTAQVVEIKQGEEYDDAELDEYNRKHAWFIAFAPADDPVIAVAVLVENGGGGSSVAGPVAREILDAYLLPQLAVR
jgi:penicillin-binding protein 2